MFRKFIKSMLQTPQSKLEELAQGLSLEETVEKAVVKYTMKIPIEIKTVTRFHLSLPAITVFPGTDHHQTHYFGPNHLAERESALGQQLAGELLPARYGEPYVSHEVLEVNYVGEAFPTVTNRVAHGVLNIEGRVRLEYDKKEKK